MPPRSRSDVSFAKKTLPYPIFAADFDPYNRGYLVVGGGGGESKTGVPNQVSVLDVSSRAVITNAVDIDLSRDEDSVQSLGALASKDGLVVFAGINSGSAEQDAGKNEHLRSFSVTYPPRKKQKTDESTDEKQGDWNLLGKRSLFQPPSKTNKETYQRLLRLSPSRKRDTGCNRIAAIATRSAKESQIVVFSATSPVPDQKDVLTTINLPEGQEAVDLDIAETDINEFSMAYCTDFDIHEQAYTYDFSKKEVVKTPKGPRRVYQLPLPNAGEGQKSRPKWRALRFLNSQNVVGLLNKPSGGGAELRIFHLYPTGPAIQIQQHKLPSRIKAAAAMDVCSLGADKDGNEQMVIAVAGQDISVEIFTTNYSRHTDTVSPLRTYLTVREVHGHQITRLVFSPFHPPDPKTQTAEQQKLTQFIRLASTSYGNTVVVDTLPLQPFDDKKKDSRWLLSHPSDEAFVKWTYFLVISMVVVVTAFLAQSFMGGFGTLDKGPFSLLPQNIRNYLDRPAAVAFRQAEWVPDLPSSTAIVGTPIAAAGKLHTLVSSHKTHAEHAPAEEKAFIVRPDVNKPNMDTGYDIDVYVHADKEEFLKQDTTNAKHWDEMRDDERDRWRWRLKKAGQWVESEGESVLKGVLFSEYAGAIGGFAGDILREL